MRLATALSLLALAAPATGQITDYTDKGVWLAAVGGGNNIDTADFNGFSFGQVIDTQYQGIGLTLTDGDDTATGGALYSDGRGLDCAGSATFVFDAPRTAMACDFPGALAIELYSAGNLVGTSTSFGGTGTDYFGGVVSSVPFDSAILRDWNDNLALLDNAFWVRPNGPVLRCDPAAPHSGGLSATLADSTFSGPGVFHLECTDGPAEQFGYFIVSSTLIEPGAPVSNGFLCLGIPIGRYSPAAGGVLNSTGQFSAGGVLQNLVGTSNVGSGYDVFAGLPNPPGGLITAGQTWYFQCWFRDGTRSNFSDVVEVTF